MALEEDIISYPSDSLGGARYWRAIDMLRSGGYDIPEFIPEAGSTDGDGNVYEKTPYGALKRVAVTAGVRFSLLTRSLSVRTTRAPTRCSPERRRSTGRSPSSRIAGSITAGSTAGLTPIANVLEAGSRKPRPSGGSTISSATMKRRLASHD